MILCLGFNDFVFSSPASGFFLLNQHMKLFCVIHKLLAGNIFVNFLFDSSYINTNFNVIKS